MLQSMSFMFFYHVWYTVSVCLLAKRMRRWILQVKELCSALSQELCGESANCTPWSSWKVENIPLDDPFPLRLYDTGGELYFHDYFRECIVYVVASMLTMLRQNILAEARRLPRSSVYKWATRLQFRTKKSDCSPAEDHIWNPKTTELRKMVETKSKFSRYVNKKEHLLTYITCFKPCRESAEPWSISFQILVLPWRSAALVSTQRASRIEGTKGYSVATVHAMISERPRGEKRPQVVGFLDHDRFPGRPVCPPRSCFRNESIRRKGFWISSALPLLTDGRNKASYR